MRDKHWHVAVGHPEGAAYAVSEYSDSAMAVRDFIRLSNSIYTGRVWDPVESEKIISENADADNFCVGIGMDTPIMIVCTTCRCDALPQCN